MGKEWYWGGKSSKRSSSIVIDRDTNISTNTSAGCMCAVFQLFDFHQFQFSPNLHHQNQTHPSILKPANLTKTSLFDLPEEPNIPKGAEAPRNSLKSEDGTSLLSIIEDEESVESLNNIQMGIDQIKTSTNNRLSNDLGSDTSSNSPGTKTPSLVARLMGLELLPEQTTSPTSATHHLAGAQKLAASRSARAPPLRPSHNKARHLMAETSSDAGNSPGTRSLPETPRISSARRSDVDHHHRLSLQLNKENEDLDFPRLSSLRRKQLKASHLDGQENDNGTRSPGYYARQIVKQVKERVTRKVGLDITNTVKSRSDHHQQHYSRRDYDLVNNSHTKSGKRSSSKGSPKLEERATSRSSSSTTVSSSCSPRLRFSDSKTSTTTTTPSATVVLKDQGFQVSRPTSILSSSSSSSSAKREQEKELAKGRRNNVEKAGNGGRKVIRPKIMQEETFVFGPASSTTNTSSRRVGNNSPDKSKSKKTPLSNDLLNLNVVPITLLALKKNTKDVVHDQKQPDAGGSDHQVSTEPKRIRPTSLLSCSESSHVLTPRHTSSSAGDDVICSPSIAAAADPRGVLRRYIARILGRTGVSATSHVSFTNWFSPSHPLDPSIFHRLEIYYSTYFIPNTSPNSHGQLLSLACNRKLVFDVVDEVLVEILRPFMNLKPWIRSKSDSGLGNIAMQGSDLIETLCSRVEGFPCKDCQVLEDIDALIDRDLCDHNQRSVKGQKEMAFEEEGEALAMEIEKDLVDTLVHETALILVGNWN